jgi:glucokinase
MGVFRRLSNKKPAYLAIDIGGTKTLLSVLSAKGEIVNEYKIATNHNYKLFLDELEKAAKELKTHGLKASCVATPGVVDRSSGVVSRFGNIPWSNVELKKDIEKRLKTHIFLENDTNLAALYEAILLDKKYKRVAYITLSTGISVKLIIDGMISRDIADAEPGFMIFEHNGALTEWEEFASGSALVEKYGKKAAEIEDPKIWQDYSANVALGLYQLLPVYRPEIVVVGGGVGAHFEKFAPFLKKELAKFKSHMVDIPPLIKAKRAEEAVIYGCYEFIKQSGK